MANRQKLLSAQAQTALRADAALARHLNWRAWPLARQIDFIFQPDAAAQLAEHIGPETALAQLHAHCVARRPAAERLHTHAWLLALAARRATVLARPELSRTLADIGRAYPRRLREVANWQPPSKNPFRQVESLIRHLFDQYGDVPAWVVAGWTTTWPVGPNLGFSAVALTLHLGAGLSLRSFRGWPVPLTKRLEHEMRQAPAGCTPLEALRYGQLAARGTLDWLGPALQTPLNQVLTATDEQFWMGVVDFFAAAPFADPRRLPAVSAWIFQRRTVGTATEPAQPGFSLRGRTIGAVLAATERWELTQPRHERENPRFEVVRVRTLGEVWDAAERWVGLPVPGFAGADERGRPVRITQLLSRAELVAEGQALGHCVASYAYSCARGRCGIFSLTVAGERALTIEVSAQRFVAQVRGRHNRRLTADERHWLVLWLGEARLTFAKEM